MMFTSSAASVIQPDPNDFLETQFMVNTARVKLTLPKKGHCWFFVDLDTRVNDFKKQCLEEDEVVKEVEVLQGNAGKAVDDG